MVKQKLEGIFTKSLKKRIDLWYMKLQVNPKAHTKTPGDYLILSENVRYIVECKQITCINGKGRFSFNRLTQEQDLMMFEDRSINNKPYLLFMFWNKRFMKSYIFLIPLGIYLMYKHRHNKKSFNLDDFKTKFEYYQLNPLKGGLINISKVLQ